LDWYAVKLFVEHSTGFSMDALHVVLGVGIQFVMAALFRTSVARPLPWLIVLLFELLNEFSDLYTEVWPEPAMQYGESAKDIILTMLLPTIILLVARNWPGLFDRPAPEAVREDDGQAELPFDA
jgi:hypothetical protein